MVKGETEELEMQEEGWVPRKKRENLCSVEVEEKQQQTNTKPNQTDGWSGGDERDMRVERKGKEDTRKNRTRREDRVGEEWGEMKMKEPGVEIRGERWDVKHRRRGWRILSSTLQTNATHRRVK